MYKDFSFLYQLLELLQQLMRHNGSKVSYIIIFMMGHRKESFPTVSREGGGTEKYRPLLMLVWENVFLIGHNVQLLYVVPS